MRTNPEQFAFDDAVAIVATANSIGALHRRLVEHPLVQYLAEKFRTSELESKLLTELAAFDRSLRSATIILLLTLAFFRSLGRPPVPDRVKAALSKSEVKWARELVQFYEPRNEIPTAVVVAETTASPALRSRVASNITEIR